jgi:glycosyltransferase involved in cell wall biosynthesis
MNEIWVAGYPSFVGGADTELDHNIDLWREYSVDINLVPMFGCDNKMRKLCDSRGCKTIPYTKDIFKDKIVVSFCNGEFLKKLPEIMEYGKPKMIIWFNCMTWLFDNEIIAIKNKWIDYYGFVSEYQKKLLLSAIQSRTDSTVQEFDGYKPYFNPKNISQNLAFNYRIPKDYFCMGRISRDDGSKFSSDMWNIYYKESSPLPTKTFILGFGENAFRKCGSAPVGLDWQTWSAGAIPVKECYDRLHCLIHKTGGSRESYCRIVPECYATGIPIITENHYALPELIINGETGFLCDSSDEMSYRASQLAFDESFRKKIIDNAYNHLVNNISNSIQCIKPWLNILK